jgi:diguanylate cyclase (GGDEF)-like protein
MKVSFWQRLKAPGRKSDLILAGILIMVFVSFEFSERSLAAIIEHLVIILGFIWLYIQYLKPGDHAVDIITDALRKHGDPSASGRFDPLGAATAATERLDRYANHVTETLRERQQMQDRRLKELSDMHQNLITHHRITKHMLQSILTEEIFEILLKGVRDGLGFSGTLLAIRDRDGYLVFHEDSTEGKRSSLRIPAWDGNSLLARTFWSGNPLHIRHLDDHVHTPEDRSVLGESPAFLLPISRKLGLQCSEEKNCRNIDCSSYIARTSRCWPENSANCTANASVPMEDRRKACVQCELFSPAAFLAVRGLSESRALSQDTIVPIVALANEATLALEVVELHENLRKMSITDGLTGLTNHREFYNQLRKELERARRYRHTVSLLIIDVDDFKKYNDRFGHLAGDLALKKIADLLRFCARATDIVARYGGEEFAVILPESSASGSLMLAERIKTEVANHNFLPQVSGEVHLTVSIGIYTAEEGAVTEDQLVGYADEAAYSAKNTGKNRVVVKTHA